MTKTDLTVSLSGQDGNIVNLTSIATNALRAHDYEDEANELRDRLFTMKSYDAALQLIMEYVKVV